MFAVHISNLIELPIHDKMKNNRKGADFSEIFLRRRMHMGKADIVTKAYMRKSNIFADAFNYLIYNGRKVINPE